MKAYQNFNDWSLSDREIIKPDFGLNVITGGLKPSSILDYVNPFTDALEDRSINQPIGSLDVIPGGLKPNSILDYVNPFTDALEGSGKFGDPLEETFNATPMFTNGKEQSVPFYKTKVFKRGAIGLGVIAALVLLGSSKSSGLKAAEVTI